MSVNGGPQVEPPPDSDRISQIGYSNFLVVANCGRAFAPEAPYVQNMSLFFGTENSAGCMFLTYRDAQRKSRPRHPYAEVSLSLVNS